VLPVSVVVVAAIDQLIRALVLASKPDQTITPNNTTTAATAYHPAASILITTLANSAADGLTRLFGQDQRPDIAHIPNSQFRTPQACVYLISQPKM